MEQSEPAQPTNETDPRIFQDPLLAQTVAEDPFFRFLSKHWKQLVTFLVIAAAVFYGRNVFHETYVTDMGRTADIYYRVRQEFANFSSLRAEREQAQAKLEKLQTESQAKISDKGKEKEAAKPNDAGIEEATKKVTDLDQKIMDARSKVESAIDSLADTRKPYVGIAQLYKGLLATTDKPQEAAKVFSTTKWQSLTASDSSERLLAELEALVAARSLIDSEETYKEGRTTLKALAEQGVFVHTSAALTLARISESDEERAEALTVLEGVSSGHPEQSDLLSPEIERLRS